MSIRAPDDMWLTLALRAFEAEQYEEAIAFFKQCTATQWAAHKEALIHAHYSVGKSLCAQDKFGMSREHFLEAMTLADSSDVKHICQARLEAINKLASGVAGRIPEFLLRYGGDCEDCPGSGGLFECATCARRGMPVNPPEKMASRSLSPEIGEIHCVGAYRHGRDRQRSNPFSKAIRAMKEPGGQTLAVALGWALIEFLRPLTDLRLNVDLITPVPTASSRYLERGFKVPDTLGRLVGSALAIPVSCVVVLTRETCDLRGLTRSERRCELDGAFAVSEPALIQGRSILVVDDVVTYGTTLREIGETLRSAGSVEVSAAVLAHTESSL